MLGIRVLLTCGLLLQLPVVRALAPTRVHPWPGGGTYESPNYAVHVDGQASFVWYTSVANRQAVAAGNNVPRTSANKDTSYTMFDMSSPLVPVKINVDILAQTAHSVEVRPLSAGIVAELTPSGKGINFTIQRPCQVCIVINGDVDKPLCIFADPAQDKLPEPADVDIYFGPGVHYAGQINVTANQTVYVAGGAHVYGQVVAVQGMPCDAIKIIGRGVLDGHNLAIDYRAKAMIELPECTDILVEGITTVDSPQYQINAFAPRGIIRYAKAIAWGYTTDGWGSGEYSIVEHCFFKVNDDSSKLYFTGMLVQHNVYWQMENGCPLMLSWNTADNVGFVTARDNDIIAHEKVSHDSPVDGLICALHGGHGNLNNYLIDGLRILGSQWAFVSVNLLPSPFAPPGKSIGNISTVILRNISASLIFNAPATDAYHLFGHSPASLVDTFVFDNVAIAGQHLTQEDVAPGIGPFATNIIVCNGCVETMFPSLADGRSVWSDDQRCGRTPQPLCNGVRLPPLNDAVGQSPLCTHVEASAHASHWSQNVSHVSSSQMHQHRGILNNDIPHQQQQQVIFPQQLPSGQPQKQEVTIV